MKKNILILILLFACFGVSNGQSLFPATQYLGTNKTNVYARGGLSTGKGFINKVYTDTTDANLDTNYIKMYPGAQIITSDNQFWIRNLLAARWVPVIATSGGITVSASSPLSVTGTPTVNPNIVADTSTLHPYALVTQAQLVKYSFSGLLNNDGLKYDSANNRWVNFRRVFTAPLSYNYNTNTLILLPLDSVNVPDLHSETYYNGKYWKFGGNSITAGTKFGTLNNTSLRMYANNSRVMVLDSVGNVQIGASPQTGFGLAVDGAIYAGGSGSVSVWIPNGNAGLRGRGNGTGTNYYIDGNQDGGNGSITLRALNFPIQATVTTTSSVTTGTFVDANLGYGYRTGGQTILTLKVDSSFLAVNNNSTARKVLYNGETHFFNDDIAGPNGWFGSGASSSLAEFRSPSRGILFPGVSKAARDAMVFTGVGGTKVAGIVSGSGYTSGNYGAVALTNITGSGTGATAKIVVNSGAVTQVSIIAPGSGYAIGDSLSSSSIGAGTGFRYVVGSLSGRSSMTVYDTTSNTMDRWNGVNWTGSLTASAAGTLSVKYGEAISFTGSTATYTLPAVSATITGIQNAIQIKNRGTGTITVNSNTGSTIYTTAAVGTISIQVGETVLFTPDGTYFTVSFTAGVPATRIILANNTQLSNTGSTTENLVYTGTIPANSIGVNGSFHITVLYSATNNANVKTARLKFNGSTIVTAALTSTGSLNGYTIIRNRNSLTSQVSGNAGSNANIGFNVTTSGGVMTYTFDTGVAITFTITLQNANAGDATGIEAVEVIGNY